MAFYPVHKELQNIAQKMPKGNFGLWYNKFIPLSDDSFKPSDDKGSNGKGDENRPVDYYFEQYGKMKLNAAETAALLKQKHEDMDDFCANFPPQKYEEIVICAKLDSPLITGIGESHPHEVSMVFDHNIGIPYIPASGVKGIIRFAHTLSVFLNDDRTVKEEYKDKNCLDESATDIPDIFGGDKNIGQDKKVTLRGKVIFLDAYPEEIPTLHMDIMNPHYAPYYSEGVFPADYHNPTPIKFLTVERGTNFIFRAVAEKEQDLSQKVKVAFAEALMKEGVGAKTAVGYGRFVIDENGQEALLKKRKQRHEEEKRLLYPWLEYIENINKVADWDQFKQIVLENEKLAEYRNEKDVAEAVRTKALEIREKWRKSWEVARDETIAAWLEPAGITWQTLSTEAPVLTNEHSKEFNEINKIKDWGAYKTSGIDFSKLPANALKLLKRKMEEWGCNEKNAKNDKRSAYKKVKDFLRQTQAHE